MLWPCQATTLLLGASGSIPTWGDMMAWSGLLTMGVSVPAGRGHTAEVRGTAQGLSPLPQLPPCTQNVPS